MKKLADLKARVTSKKLRAAITLVELTLVLALAAIVVFVAVRAYSQAQNNSRVQQAASEVGQIRAAVESVYATQGNYGGAAGSIAASIQGALPGSYKNGTALTSPYNGLVDVLTDKTSATASYGDSYTVVMTAVPKDACVRLAAVDMGKSVVAVSIGANGAAAELNGANSTEVTALPVTAAMAEAGCAATLNNISWQFQ